MYIFSATDDFSKIKKYCHSTNSPLEKGVEGLTFIINVLQ